jgi:hypothetical protein
MIVDYSDTHKELADMAAGAEHEEKGGSRFVLIEATAP